MRPTTPVILSLLALATGGLVLAQGLSWRPEEPVLDVPAAAVAAGPLRVAEPGGQVAADVEAVLQRPPFTAGRRPYVAPVAGDAASGEEEVAAPDVPVPTVVGVALSSNRAVAVVMEADGGRTRRVAAGDELTGWRVIAIDRERVTFGSEKAKAVVYLKKSGTELQVEVTPVVSEVAERDARGVPPKPEPGSLY
jgi:hypothetical protein